MAERSNGSSPPPLPLEIPSPEPLPPPSSSFQSDQDSMLQVKKDAYSSCNTSSYISKLDDGNTVFTFNQCGPFYFISGVEQNCIRNESLLVVVMAERSNGSYPPPPPPKILSPRPSPPPSSSFQSDQDLVLQVKKDAYNNCNTSSYISNFDDGNIVFTFNRCGPFYFISDVQQNCFRNESLLVVFMAERNNISSPTLPPLEIPSPGHLPPPSSNFGSMIIKEEIIASWKGKIWLHGHQTKIQCFKSKNMPTAAATPHPTSQSLMMEIQCSPSTDLDPSTSSMVLSRTTSGMNPYW